MAPPAAGESAAAAADQESARRDGKDTGSGTRRRPRPDCAGAGARLLSLGVQAAVMAAALAVFLLFAAAAAILLLHLVVAARAFRNQHRGGSRYRVPETSPSSPPPYASRTGLSPADLRLLPCFAVSSSSSSQLCAVCLDVACAGERWRALPACGHSFHAACVDRWLARTAACPVCRAAVSVSVG
ncbi:RING-H2 finger protein ATL56-like [Oryza brachyantha]|uniref:RING-H2 finger protein ATL56-like n=1 Tax=Oryza brachyantha TaxID=4533 RepID=UPI001ADD5C2E|nr:RING-H2 finger protein ATL56-like [Oryza brachyantha]XP_040376251.1 RING-H2 finger protein ATL56-like [Oryza brachyantha]XP_040376252.1 RING-H2 finger protein ATL56-like [Oryza brachyantha]XP_040376253.1 RING-H2 finger protein ATL56-like [Oryza brachyantha]